MSRVTMTLLVNILSTTIPLLLLLLAPTTQGQTTQPHIVIIMADDMGFNDAGFRDKQMITPNIDKLASKSVLLNNSYMLKSCTPSRSTFLTGVYAYRMGLQDESLFAAYNYSVPLDKKLFAEELQAKGYSTHYVGKWHLGFCKPEMTPTRRGFDTFYGMYNGGADYYTHVSKWDGYDNHDDNATDYGVDWSANGTYSADLYTDKALEIVNNHNKSKPLLLFLAYQSVHGPLQYPSRYYDEVCANVTYENDLRRQHCALTAAMDESIGKLRKALKKTGIDDNLITLFTSDNGGPYKIGSSNWPLRGGKTTEWEGGTRVMGFVHSKKHLPNAPYTYNGMIHAVDWYPTLLAMAGLKTNNTDINGVNSWDRIVNNQTSRRTEFVYNINEVQKNYAYRWMQYKLAHFENEKPADWYYPPPGEQPKKSLPKKNRFDKWLLFDVIQDPSEVYDVAKKKENKCIVKDMKRHFSKYKANLMKVVTNRPKLAAAHPSNFNGAWSTGWC